MDVMIGSWFVVLATVPLAMGIAGGSIFMSRANTGPMSPRKTLSLFAGSLCRRIAFP